MQKQQCNKEHNFSIHDAFYDASFFEDALYTRQQPTLNLTSARSASLVVIHTSLRVRLSHNKISMYIHIIR